MKDWYALYTKPHAEYQVVAVIKQKDVEYYLPEIMVTTAKQVKKKVPFFPNYLFVRIDLEVFPISDLRWIPGLRHAVSFNGRPAAVPQAMISLIRQKLDTMNMHGGIPSHSFKSGDSVRVIQGPFEGMIGVFEETTPANRVRILLTILGNINRAQVPIAAVEKVSSTDATSEQTKEKRPRRTRGRGRRITH